MVRVRCMVLMAELERSEAAVFLFQKVPVVSGVLGEKDYIEWRGFDDVEVGMVNE